MLYAKGKCKKVKKKATAYGKWFFIISIMCLLGAFMCGIEILNPSLMLLIGLSLIALVLIYIDGWLTNKAVGSDLAVEANPIAVMSFKRFGIRKTRIAIFALVVGFLVWLNINSEMAGVFALCLLWLFVDGNNIVVWHKIKQKLNLKARVIEDEIGFEDIHEL